jgi:hypothetical protein
VLGNEGLRQFEIEVAQGIRQTVGVVVGVGHVLEGRTGPFQVKTAVIFARLFGGVVTEGLVHHQMGG